MAQLGTATYSNIMPKRHMPNFEYRFRLNENDSDRIKKARAK